MEMKLSYVIKKIIQEKMKELKITENELATRSGLTTSTLNSFMNNKNASCTMTTLAKVCFGLNITLQEFFSHPYFKMKIVGDVLIDD